MALKVARPRLIWARPNYMTLACHRRIQRLGGLPVTRGVKARLSVLSRENDLVSSSCAASDLYPRVHDTENGGEPLPSF